MKSPRWEIVHTGFYLWHARFIAANGRIIVSSENYRRRRDALRAVELTACDLIWTAKAGDLDIDPRLIIGKQYVMAGGYPVDLEVRDVDEREKP